MAMPNHLRFVVFRESDQWIGQCLEYDIGAQAETLDELRLRLEITVAEEAKDSTVNGIPFTDVPAAPQAFFDMWERCKNMLNYKGDGQEDAMSLDLALCA